MAAGTAVIDLTAISSDDDDTPEKNASLVRRAPADWVGVDSPAKRRRLSTQVCGPKPARCCRY